MVKSQVLGELFLCRMLLIYPEGFKQQMHFHNSKSILCKTKAIQTRIAAKFPSKTFFAARLLFFNEQMPSLHCFNLRLSSFQVPDLASYYSLKFRIISSHAVNFTEIQTITRKTASGMLPLTILG